MSSCDAVDALMTLYIDGEASHVERRAAEAHLSTCATCRTRVAAQAAVRRLVRTRAAEARAMGVSPPWRPRALGGDFAPSNKGSDPVGQNGNSGLIDGPGRAPGVSFDQRRVFPVDTLVREDGA